MARLRYDLLETTLGASLTDSATSVTFSTKLTAADGDIPTVASPDYLPLVIGDEIVYLTAYTAEATTGTISRGEEGTTAAAHDSGVAVQNNPTVDDFDKLDIEDQAGTTYTVTQSDSGSTLRFTSSSAVTVTLPDGIEVGSVVEIMAYGTGGVTITDNGTSTVEGAGSITQYESASCVVVAADTWVVSGVPAGWTAYTPTVSGWTIGSGSISGLYRKIGKTLDLRGSFTLSSTTTSASPLAISLPSGMTGASQRQAGTAILRDSGGGTLYMAFALVSSGGSTIVFYETNADNTFVNNTNPFTWADGDSVEWNMTLGLA